MKSTITLSMMEEAVKEMNLCSPAEGDNVLDIPNCIEHSSALTVLRSVWTNLDRIITQSLLVSL